METVHSPSLSTGTEILTVQAADNDDPKTDNVRIFYRLVGQIPESPRALFRVDRDSGVISVQADSMEGTAPQYTLTITAEDAKGDFNENYNEDLCFDNIADYAVSCLSEGQLLLFYFSCYNQSLFYEEQKFREKYHFIWRLGKASSFIDFWEGDINAASSQNTRCSIRFLCPCISHAGKKKAHILH